MIYFSTITNEETYVAGGGGCSEIVFLAGSRKSAPGLRFPLALSYTGTSAGLSDLTPKEFKLFFIRIMGGGGLVIMVAGHMTVKRCKMSQFSSFDAMCCKILSSSFGADVICPYRQTGYMMLILPPTSTPLAQSVYQSKSI